MCHLYHRINLIHPHINFPLHQPITPLLMSTLIHINPPLNKHYPMQPLHHYHNNKSYHNKSKHHSNLKTFNHNPMCHLHHHANQTHLPTISIPHQHIHPYHNKNIGAQVHLGNKIKSLSILMLHLTRGTRI